METQTRLATLTDSASAELRRGCEANLVGTRAPGRAENSQRPHSAVAKLSWSLHSLEPLKGLSLRQHWNWLLRFGCNAEETSETTQQILCCDSSAALGMIKRSTRKTRHIKLKAFFLQHMERATGSETCPSGDERNACGLFNKDTAHTKFDLSLDSDWRSNPVLNRLELGRKDRAEEVCINSTPIFNNFCGLSSSRSLWHAAHIPQ